MLFSLVKMAWNFILGGILLIIITESTEISYRNSLVVDDYTSFIKIPFVSIQSGEQYYMNNLLCQIFNGWDLYLVSCVVSLSKFYLNKRFTEIYLL